MKRVTLGEISTRLISGGTPPLQIESHWRGNIPWVTGADILDQKVGDIRRFINERAVATTATNVVPKGALLLVTRTGVGKMAIAPFDIAISQDFTGVILNTDLADAEFVYYYLQANSNRLRALIQGTSINGVVRNDLVNLVLEIPPKAEQSTVVTLLSDVDRAIEQTEALIVKYQRIKTGLMHDLLTRGVDEHGNLRDPATHKFKDSPLGRIPGEWELVKFRSVCTGIGVGIATSTTKHFREKGVPLIRNQNIRKDGLETEDLVYISESFSRANRSKMLRENDIVTVRTGYPGLSCLISGREAGWQTFTTLISRPNPKVVFPPFLVLLLNSHICKGQIANLQAGGAQQNLNARVLENLDVLHIAQDEQRRICRVISTPEILIRKEQSQLAMVHRFRAGLMQDLLTGDVSVQPLLQ